MLEVRHSIEQLLDEQLGDVSDFRLWEL